MLGRWVVSALKSMFELDRNGIACKSFSECCIVKYRYVLRSLR